MRSIRFVILLIYIDNRKINDLHRSFRYLISWRHARRKLVYRVHTLVVAVCTRSHVAFNANDVHIDDIYRLMIFIRFTIMIPTRFDENLNSDQFSEIYSISVFDLALHCIIISVNSQRILFILFVKCFLSRSIVGMRL